MSAVEIVLVALALVPWSLVFVLSLGLLKLLRGELGRDSLRAITHDAFGFLKAQSLQEKTSMDYLSAQPPVVVPVVPPGTPTSTLPGIPTPGRDYETPTGEKIIVDELLKGKVQRDIQGNEWELV